MAKNASLPEALAGNRWHNKTAVSSDLPFFIALKRYLALDFIVKKCYDMMLVNLH